VWCAASAKWIIGLIFSHKTMNLDWYVQNISKPFCEQLTDEDSKAISNKIVQLNIAQTTQSALPEVFDGWIISTGIWPPRTDDLSVWDFYLWGNLQEKLYMNHLCTA
jgi:hypothetical protein